MTSLPVRICRILLDWTFPRTCAGCAAPLGSEITGPLCAKCRPGLKHIERACLRCAKPLGQFIDVLGPCIYCRDFKYHFDSAIAAGEYNGALRAMIISFKYERRKDLFPELSGFFQGAVLKRLTGPKIDAVVPVPLHRKREQERGFNQSEMFARPLASALGAELAAGKLQRLRLTKSQVGLTPTQRFENVAGAFEVKGGDFEGKCVLLIDDVMTTGATGSECAKVLKAAGATHVFFAVLARQVS
jgi:competence protein ComFC